MLTALRPFQLINCCWVFTPSSRPTFDQIRQIIAERIDPNRESPVDMMINMVTVLEGGTGY